MKKSFMLVAVALLAFAGSALAQNSASTTSTASARIIRPIAVFAEEQLNFGSFFSGATAGTVVVTANNVDGSFGTSRTATGGVVLYTGAGGAHWQQGEFDIDGELGFTYAWTTPGTHTVTSGANTMNYTLNAPVAAGVGAVVGVCGDESPNENDAIEFGGVLTVPANQAVGTYTGTYTFQANYN